MSTERLKNIANWIIGIDASLRSRNLMRDLNVSNDVKMGDMSNPRATALLVYDGDEETAHFNEATYIMSGAGTAGVGVGPGPWTTSSADQRPLLDDHREVETPGFIRVFNKTYTEHPSIIMTGDNAVVKPGSRVFVYVEKGATKVAHFSIVEHVYFRDSTKLVYVYAEGRHALLDSNIYRELTSMTLDKISTVARGSTILHNDRRILTVTGVYSNGAGDYKVRCSDDFVYGLDDFSYEAQTAGGFKVGDPYVNRGVQDPVKKIYRSRGVSQLLLQSNTLLRIAP